MSGMKTSGKVFLRKAFGVMLLLPFLLLCIPIPYVSAQTTATMDITVTGTTNADMCYPLNLTVPYKIDLVDPVSGVVSTLYPNRMLNVSSQELVTTGSYSINSLANTLTFYTGMNVSAGNFTANYRLIYDSVLMTNNTIDTSTHVYGVANPYYIPVTINNAGSTIAGYQVMVTVDTTTPISAGHMRSDGGDIRFYAYANFTSPISYWVENEINTASTKIWINDSSIPAGASTVYMSYGNSSATSISNGTAVFPFFDTFDGASINSALWSNNSAPPTPSGGMIHFEQASTYTQSILSKASFNQSASEIRYRIRITSAQDQRFFFGFQGTIGADGSKYPCAGASTYDKLYSYYDSSYAAYDFVVNTWYTVAVRMSADYKHTVILVGTSTNSTSATALASTNNKVWMGGTTIAADVDWVFVRNYTATDPSATPGSEQAMVSYSITITYGPLSTESQLTVQMPKFSATQYLFINATANYEIPITNLGGTITLILETPWGPWLLAIIPVFIMLLAGGSTGAVASILALALATIINFSVSTPIFRWGVLGVIAFIALLMLFAEGGKRR